MISPTFLDSVFFALAMITLWFIVHWESWVTLASIMLAGWLLLEARLWRRKHDQVVQQLNVSEKRTAQLQRTIDAYAQAGYRPLRKMGNGE
jgi:hypothetical protein